MFRYLVIFLIIIIPSLVLGQQTLMQKADSCLKNGDNLDAVEHYKKALKKEEYKNQFAHIYYSLGIAQKRENHYKEALEHFERSIKEGLKEIEVYYLMGEMKMDLGQYEAAKPNFELYKEFAIDDKKADVKIKSCDFAVKTLKETPLYQINNEKMLNSVSSDYGVGYFHNKIYFASTRIDGNNERFDTYTGQGFSDIYESKFDMSYKSFSSPNKIKGEVNTKFNEGSLFYDEKSSTMYYMQCNGNSGKSDLCNILTSTYNEKNNKWEAPIKLNVINQEFSVGHPSLSQDGNTLYFVSDMPGGKGGKDIWYMRKQADNTWADLHNIGEINTPGNELFPYDNGDTVLYFSSDGHIGMGGLDLYKASIKGKDKFSKPINLKLPFNSSADDFSMLPITKEYGLFCSNRQNGVGDDDIYSYRLIPVNITVSGHVTEQGKNKSLSGALVTLKGNDGSIQTVKTDGDGNYKFENLKANTDYTIQIAKEGYFSDSKTLKVGDEKFSRDFNKTKGEDFDFSLIRIQTKQEVEIPNIYYDFNSAELRDSSKKELDKLVVLLKETPNVNVIINSHTDERGENEYNFKLSSRRAESVVNYLISKGIAKARLDFKGFGETIPLVKNATTEEDHQRNRRTTFKVSKK